jgi:hypothetical protein
VSIGKKGIPMKTASVGACVLLVGVVVWLSAGRSQELPEALQQRTLISLLKPGDFVALSSRTDAHSLTVYSKEEAEKLLRQQAERKALAEQLNTTSDAGKREELQLRMRELTVSGRIPVRICVVTTLGTDFVGLSYQGETDDARRSARELCIPVWSISSLSRMR